jgi:hypothetical protein
MAKDDLRNVCERVNAFLMALPLPLTNSIVLQYVPYCEQ